MLIKALCDYYELLEEKGLALSGYSVEKVDYIIALNEDGIIDSLIDCRQTRQITTSNGKIKTVTVPKEVVLPQRQKIKGAINIIEHRPGHIFGLSFKDGKLTVSDDQSRHEEFVKNNLEFLTGLNSPVINAYRKFLENWSPEDEIGNENLLSLGSKLGASQFAFCLSGFPDKLLNDDKQIKEKWEAKAEEEETKGKKPYIAQCAVSGKEAKIARLHHKIDNVGGKNPALISYNEDSGCSYVHEQSHNSNISYAVMSKYVAALNYLSRSPKNKIQLDDLVIIIWAMKIDDAYEDGVQALLFGQSDKTDENTTEKMLMDLLESAKSGKITKGRLNLESIDPNVDFYMLGLLPNEGRLAVKFIYRKKYAELLWNIARFQEDLQITREIKPVSVAAIKNALNRKTAAKNDNNQAGKGKKSQDEKSNQMNPALMSKIFESVIYGKPYPVSLLENVVRRVKIDVDADVGRVRAGIIKACINRNFNKEELKVGLDRKNTNQAYLCGRLFAVLEEIQRDAADGELNRTIKNSYFASAASTPAVIFQKLVILSQHHMEKVKNPTRYSKWMDEITDKFDGGFPETLSLVEQGKFIVGYYQQHNVLSIKNEEEN